MPAAVIYLFAAMLFAGAAPLPYGYYMLIRLVACGVFAFSAFVSHERKSKILPWVFGLLAILFNPIIKVHFPKEIWAAVDLAAGLFVLATAKAIRANPSQS